MNKGKFQNIFAALALLTAVLITPAQKDTTALPNVFLIDARQLSEVKQDIATGDKRYDAAVAKIGADAKKALSEGLFTVTSKTATPPSGDKHDYMSQARYFWPDPKSPNGLPYIRRDGER